MKDLYIFNIDEELETVLSNDNENNNFYDAVHIERINSDNRLEFSVPADKSYASFVNEGGFVGFFDVDGDFQYFEIKRIEEEHGELLFKNVFCEHTIYELLDEYVIALNFVAQSPEIILDFLLNQEHQQGAGITRWSVGIIEVFDVVSIRYRDSSIYQAIIDLAVASGGELRFRLEFSGNVITNRYIDILERRGEDTGKRFEYGHDLENVSREIDANNVITAMYGFGKGEEIPGVGKSHLRFRDVVFINEDIDGRLVNKPVGQIFVEDPVAKERFGRENGTKNRFGVFINEDQFNERELLIETWRELQTVNEPLFSYKMKVLDLEEITGIVAHRTRLGDGVMVIDDLFQPSLETEARIVEYRRHLLNPENNQITLANIRPEIVDDGEVIRNNNRTIKNNQGIWEENAYVDNLIIDGSFENVPIVGDVDEDTQSFSVDTSHVDHGNLFWWFWEGNDPRVVSILETGLFPQTLFDLQGALVTSESRPRIAHLPHQSVGFDGPYTSSVYVAPTFTSEEGTALLRHGVVQDIPFELHEGNGTRTQFNTEFSPVKRFSEVISVNFVQQTRGVHYTIDYQSGLVTFNTAPPNNAFIVFGYLWEITVSETRTRISGEEEDRFIWKRMRTTLTDLPSVFDFIFVEILVDEEDNPDCIFMADGVQVVPLPNPAQYEPQTDLWRHLQNQAGLRLKNPSFVGNLSAQGISITGLAEMGKSGPQSILSNTFVQVVFQVIRFNNDSGLADLTNNRFVIQRSGIYKIRGGVTMTTNNTGIRIVRIMRNGVEIIRKQLTTSTDIRSTMTVERNIFFEQGDLITLEGWQNSGITLSILTNPETFLFIQRIG